MAHADYGSSDLTKNRVQSERPYLSIVAASRNDDHGGDPLVRTQIFINNFARQCQRYKLPSELILVDWNPVQDRPGLAAVLSIPAGCTYCRTRVITVPETLHRRLKYSDRLAFFQMIAKNVGIRRAEGRFILATNIDILFSDELIQFLARQELDPASAYRVDRYDIAAGLSVDSSLDECLEYAWANPIRANRRYQPGNLIQHLYGSEIFKESCIPSPEFIAQPGDGVQLKEEGGVWQVRPDRGAAMTHLHTNACGDFTLLSREGWEAIRGYPEFEAFSFNIDSIGFLAAHYAGYQEVSLLPPCVCFHIEHAIGSGWTPQGERRLFDRLRQAEILNPEWPVLIPLVDEMRNRQRALEFNHSGWGLAEFSLYERSIGDTTEPSVEMLNQLGAFANQKRVSAIQPEYDLDRLTLAYERRSGQAHVVPRRSPATGASDQTSPKDAESEKIVLYIPDSSGNYSEGRTIISHANLMDRATVVFRVEEFARQYPLRLDPCQCSGLINIDSLAVLDAHNHRIVWELDDQDLCGLTIEGTAVRVDSRKSTNGHRRPSFLSPSAKRSQKPLRLISTGLDPQIVLPPLPGDISFPVFITVEMKLLPLLT